MKLPFFIVFLLVIKTTNGGIVSNFVSGALGAIQGLNQDTNPSETITFPEHSEPGGDVEKHKIDMRSDQIIVAEGYPVETHHVMTPDAYNLTVFRIPRPGAVPVYLLHGVLCSSREFLVQPKRTSLPFQLYDAGFDVWIGNIRGTTYSPGHLKYKTDDNRFWQYSSDHIAKYDVPTAIDYVLAQTQKEKLVFIGYSLGTQTFFYAMALQPEYNYKIIHMIALAPFVYLGNLTSPFKIFTLAPNELTVKAVLDHGAFFPEKLLPLIGEVLPDACKPGNVLQDVGNGICARFTQFLMGPDFNETNRAVLPVAFGEFPNQISVFVISQLLTDIKKSNGRHYDYGSAEANQAKYGTSLPPKYHLENIIAPITLYSGKSDAVVHPKDVDWLANDLPCYPRRRYVEHFNHLDFVYGKHVPIMNQHVVRDLLDIIKTGSFQELCQNVRRPNVGGDLTDDGNRNKGIVSSIIGGVGSLISKATN